MAFRGERFVVDLDDDTITIPSDPVPSPFSLIGEIREREPTAATPPAPAPPSSASSTGFPAHRRRTKTPSFKERRAEQKTTASVPSASLNTPPTIQDDKRAIEEENKRHLASMSEAQIQREREELMASMDPGLLERFLRRARIDDDDKPSSDTPEATSTTTPAPATVPTGDGPAPSKPQKSVSFDIPLPSSAPTQVQPSQKPSKTPTSPANDDRPPAHLPKDLRPASEAPPIMDPAVIETFHFPRPTKPMPVLDPSSPNFLTDLQSHYFPEMTTDPAALSWLRPPSSDPEDPDSISPYHPASSASSMSPSEIRFSLRGTILGPSTSLALPTTLGLHHHGNDPQAAGYTIPELAILSRSTFAAQRCIAWQVLGRILFRLGKGEFGERGGQLSEGLWFVIEKEGVVGGMLAEADGFAGQDRVRGKGESEKEVDEKNDTKEQKEDEQDRPALPVASGIGRHASAAAWAMEGVWLWQKGGGGDRGLLKPGQTRPR